VAIEEAVGEEDQVGGETVAAYVAAFPGLVREGGGESDGSWAASDGAARVVAAVGADEVDRVGAWGAGVGTGEDVQEVVVGGEFAPADRFLPGATVDQRPPARGGPIYATVASDQGGADAGCRAQTGHFGGQIACT